MAAPTFAVGQAPWETQQPATPAGSFAVGQAPWETAPQATLPPAPATDTNGANATFPASPTDNPFIGSLKLIGNMPSSAVNFAKNTFNFLNPLNTIKTAQDIGTQLGQITPDEQKAISSSVNNPDGTYQNPGIPGAGALPGAKSSGPIEDTVRSILGNIPAAAEHALVPQFIQHIMAGNNTKAAETLRNDPINQILPLLLVGRQAAHEAGQGAQFDQAIQAAASPLTRPVAAAGRGAVNLGTQTLGASTGAGASSIQAAFQAGKAGSSAFTDAMRGKINPDEVVQGAQDAVQTIADNRRAQYLADLEKVSSTKTSLDISPVVSTLNTQLKNFGVKIADDGSLDFSRSSIANNGSARADIQGVYDTVKNWGSQTGDRSAVGLDTLKKQLGDFYSPSGSARAFVQAVKSNVSGILQSQVPGYSEMTGNYAKASGLLDDIKSATGAGGNAKVDTVFTKLTTAMKSDKELRLEVMREMMQSGGVPELESKIAGINMQSIIPKGLVGRSIDVGVVWTTLAHAFTPQFAGVLLTTSPRLVGEFMNGLGVAAKYAQPIVDAVKAVNNVTNKGGLTALNKTAQDNNVSVGLATKDITSPEFKDTVMRNVSSALEKWHTPTDIQKAMSDDTFALQQLKAKDAAGKALTQAELRQAVGLLRAQGIETIPNVAPKTAFIKDKVTGKLQGSTSAGTKPAVTPQ